MNSPVITFDRLQTLSRKPFDPETISVVVGVIAETCQMRVVIRDEKSGASETLLFNPDTTEDQVNRLLLGAAEDLKLVPGPDKIGNDTTD